MWKRHWLGWGVVLGCAAIASAQQPVPLADPVEEPLLPPGITERDVYLTGDLGYLFTDEDGTPAAHLLGDAAIFAADGEGPKLRGREAIVWISTRAWKGRQYEHLEVLLWRDAEVTEAGGTYTESPALFVTLNTFGKIKTHVNDYTRQSSANRELYREGNTIRKAFAQADVMPDDESTSLRVIDTSGLAARRDKPEVRSVLIFQAPDGQFKLEKRDGRDVITVIGGAYMARGTPQSDEFLEIQAENVVVFLPRGKDAVNDSDGPEEVGLGTESAIPAKRRRQMSPTGTPQVVTGPFGDEVQVEGVYLEGDVRMSQGVVTIRASRLYYDFLREQALILDAVVHTTLADRNVPLYIRADEIRQLSANQYTATSAMVTTSEFHTPHYHVGAKKVELINRTPAEPTGEPGRIRSGSFHITDATLNLLGQPIAWWPRLRGNVDTSETAIRSARTGYSGDFGVEVETDWHLFNVLGLQTPEGFDSTLSLDYFSERGPAIGIDGDYEREKYFGEFRTYLMADKGEDDLGRKRENIPTPDIRGRALLRHRQYLDDDWQLSLELSYISDRNFLEEYFESEFDNEKDQETLLHLKKQRDNWAFTALLQTRIMDFFTQTERYPDLAFHWIGENLGDNVTWFSENRAGFNRYRPKEQTFRELLMEGETQGSGTVGRVDSRQEFGSPLDLGTWRFVPFASVRGSAWDDSPMEGGIARAFGTVGVRGSTYLWKVYPETRSELFDVDGIRHVIKPDIVAWAAASNKDSEDLFPFDPSVEGIDEVDGVTIGVRQRWQTKRGAGENRRIVDLVTWNVETGFFSDAPGDVTSDGFASFSRPENSIARNYIASSVVWRINDRTALLSDFNYDVTDGSVDIFNLSMAVERTPRFSYLLGYRYIGDTNSNLMAFDLNYKMTEKHTLAVRELFDLDRGRTLDFTIGFIRKFPRWFGALAFELDDAEDDYGISFSMWPEGLPNAALGSRRFTGLATSTRLEND